MFGDNVYSFFTNLKIYEDLPIDVEVMNPYEKDSTKIYLKKFCDHFYSGGNRRILVMGINPGRFGGGMTGINFTDPIILEKICNIPNDLPKVKEISSEYVYRFIEKWGGPIKFYKDFYLSALSPLGFVKNGKNYNYYDDRKLQEKITPFIVENIQKQIDFGCSKKVVILFGTGKNMKYFSQINSKKHFFTNILSLEHPRFIIQYRRRNINDYLKKYNEVFTKALMLDST